MDVSSLLGALILIGIIAIVGWVIVSIMSGKVPPVAVTVVWAVIGILCLLVLYQAVVGGGIGITVH